MYLPGAGRAGYPSRRELRSSGDVAPGCVTPVAYATDINIILLGEQLPHPCRQDILHDLDPDLQISASTSFSLGCPHYSERCVRTTCVSACTLRLQRKSILSMKQHSEPCAVARKSASKNCWQRPFAAGGAVAWAQEFTESARPF